MSLFTEPVHNVLSRSRQVLPLSPGRNRGGPMTGPRHLRRRLPRSSLPCRRHASPHGTCQTSCSTTLPREARQWLHDRKRPRLPLETLQAYRLVRVTTLGRRFASRPRRTPRALRRMLGLPTIARWTSISASTSRPGPKLLPRPTPARSRCVLELGLIRERYPSLPILSTLDVLATAFFGRPSNPPVPQEPRLDRLREQHVAEQRQDDVRPVGERQRREPQVASDWREWERNAEGHDRQARS